ncbi:MAG: 1,2-phenylacetyl-CoA epoxidase subunit PaaD [Candidatus Dormiibacterota bacterium]
MPRRSQATLRDLVGAIPDPELPMITIDDLGILRDLRVAGERVEIEITPTYSGCPAMDAIRDDIVALVKGEGVSDVEVRTVLSPAWSSDWMSEAGRLKLREAGIAPPGPSLPRSGLMSLALLSVLSCPHCGSEATEELSRFSSTACKALHRCRACGEPFEQFKAH